MCMKVQQECITGPRIISAEALNAFSETEKIVKSAKQKAESILSHAEKEASQMRSKGFKEGLSAGKSKAISVILMANRYRSRLEQDAVKDIIALCMDIVELFIRTCQKEHENWLEERVRKGLSDLFDQRSVTVKLNPKDWQSHQDILQQIAAGSLLEGSVKFFPDSDIDAGDCVFESAAGTIDASITQCINGIKQFLLETESGNTWKGC